MKVSPLNKNTIKFLNWFAEYNIVPKGMALKLVLISSVAIEDKKEAYKDFESNIKNSLKLSDDQKKSLDKMIISSQKFRVHVLQSNWFRKNFSLFRSY